MKKVALIFFGLTLLWACQGSSGKESPVAQTKDIIIYGSNNCDHCVGFREQLDSVGFTYDFRDVELNYALYNEMVGKVQQARIMGQVNYPVVDIEGSIMIAPSISEVLVLMNPKPTE